MDWKRRAQEYQAALEAKEYLLITKPTILRRKCVVTWRRKDDGVTGQSAPFRQDFPIGPAVFLHNLKKNGARDIRVTRIWVLVEERTLSPTSTEVLEIERWDHIEMALAQRNGRNFHYSKWLMTKDMDRITDDLAGGVKPRR